MNLRLLATPVVVATLLLSTLGCSKKEEATPVATGSYKLDGVLRNCKVERIISPASPPQSYDDFLTIVLTTDPQPTSGEEIFQLTYSKSPTRQATHYQPLILYHYPAGYRNSGMPYINEGTTFQDTNGSYSGTFTGKVVLASGATAHTIRDGVFANVRP